MVKNPKTIKGTSDFEQYAKYSQSKKLTPRGGSALAKLPKSKQKVGVYGLI